MDSFSMFIAMIGVSVPSFILGALFQYFLALQLRKAFHINLFPIQGWGSFNQTILPAFALGLGSLATVSRLMRTSMLDVLSQDYIKTAKSKGLSPRQIIWRILKLPAAEYIKNVRIWSGNTSRAVNRRVCFIIQKTAR